MRPFCFALFAGILFAPAGVFGQTVSYEVRGRTVRLEVDPDHLLVRPQKDVGALQAAEAAIRVQAEALGVNAKGFLDDLKARPPVAVRQVRGVLVPRLKDLEGSAVAGLAKRAGDELRSSEPVYRFQGRLVIPTGTLSVRFKRDPAKALAEDRKLQELDHPAYSPNVVRVQPIERGADPFAVAARLRERDDVRWAEPDLVFQIDWHAAEKVPNDPYFKYQWHLQSIHAPQAWALSVGSDQVTVAVIDTGVDLKHPDLKDKLVKGYDFLDGDDDPQPDEKPGVDGHGTCCAGIIGALTDNGEGTAGIAWHCKIMPLRIGGSAGFAVDTEVAKSFLFARDNGARVISCSWGGGPPNNKIMEAIDAITEAGCLVFFSAGNEGQTPNPDVRFPASYEKCVAVGGVCWDDTRVEYSCYGPGNQVALVAPTGGIWTSDISGSAGFNRGFSETGDKMGNYFNRFNGTSAACPVVAGVAALVWSAHPNLKAPDVLRLLEETADKVDPENGDYQSGRSKQYGFGKVNALAAMRKAAQIDKSSGDAGRSGDGPDPAAFAKGLGKDAPPPPAEPAGDDKRIKAVLEPAAESWEVRGQTITVRPSKEWVAVVVPADPDRGKQEQARVVQPGKAGDIKEIRKEKDRRTLLVPRQALKGPAELKAAAKDGPLPHLVPVYQSGDDLLVPLDTISCRLEDKGELEKLQAFARSKKLEIVERNGDVVQLRWARSPDFATAFEAMRAVQKAVRTRWCEPDFARQIKFFGR
jgi:subtilisin family serine protease